MAENRAAPDSSGNDEELVAWGLGEIQRLREELAESRDQARRLARWCLILRARMRRITRMFKLCKTALGVSHELALARNGPHSQAFYKLGTDENKAVKQAAVTVGRLRHLPLYLVMTRETRQLLAARAAAGDGAFFPSLFMSYNVVTYDTLQQCMDHMARGTNRHTCQLVSSGEVPTELKNHPWFKRKQADEYFELAQPDNKG